MQKAEPEQKKAERKENRPSQPGMPSEDVILQEFMELAVRSFPLLRKLTSFLSAKIQYFQRYSQLYVLGNQVDPD